MTTNSSEARRNTHNPNRAFKSLAEFSGTGNRHDKARRFTDNLEHQLPDSIMSEFPTTLRCRLFDTVSPLGICYC